MGQFATGVTVLTAGGRDGHGMTANAFTSVSLEPPLVLCCVAKAARIHEVIMTARSFAVSILGGDQRDVAKHFADWRRPRGRAQFDAIGWFRGPRTGTPLVADALAWLECELVKVYAGGDHSIFVGEVLDARRGEGGPALVFHGGEFQTTGGAPSLVHDRKAIS
nr:flavin reductase family protein [Amycolatopsis arida]